jgi:hypothetical protein
VRIFGKQISAWWMLLAIPIFILGAPVLLMGFFAANNLAGAILGPPAIWERPSSTPPHQDIVGEYQEIARQTEDQTHGNAASLALRADGTMVVDGLPYEFYPKTCTISGTKRWSGPDGDDQRIYLVVTSKEGRGVCASGQYPGLEVTGRSKPYGLYWVIGDPDSGTDVRLSRKKD